MPAGVTLRRGLLAVAAGLALADASVVTLALPQLLGALDTTVEGVAAVIGVYTVVLAVALVPAERLSRRLGARAVGAAGFAVLAVASLACARAGSLPALLAGRAVQALGGAAALPAAFALLTPPGAARPDRRLWLGVAVLATAAGPTLGGALTEAFSWRTIFSVQVPIAAAAAVAALAVTAPAQTVPRPAARRRPWAAGLALALVSAALTAVLFLLVLLLVAGWGVEPLPAALTVTVLPLAALVATRVGGPARWRAVIGCGLVGVGTLALTLLPNADVVWALAPQILAGLGMGLALPALSGELLPERDPRDAARLLSVRHAGIAVALAVLAPVVAARLDDATQRARERGVAVVLDSRLPPQDKLSLAPKLLSGVNADEPRDGLRAALARQRRRLHGSERATFDALGRRADETLVAAAGEAFRAAFLITGALALLGAVVLLVSGTGRRAPAARGPAPAPGLVLAALAAAVLVVGATALAHARLAPETVVIRDPCAERALPDSGGIAGFLQDRALKLLDRGACRFGASREEYVLALANPRDARRFERAHGTDPRSTPGLLDALTP